MRPLVLILAVAAVLLAHGAHAQRTRTRPPFTLTPVTSTVPTLISCDSVLVKANPDNYPHCHCEFGPWSPFKFSSYQTSSTCPSGNKYVLESTRTRLSTKCTRRPATESKTKEVCEPTLEEKAKKAIEQLGLGERPDGAPGRPAPRSRLNITTTIPRLRNIIPVNQTNPRGGGINITTPVRQRRAAGLPIACPASQSEKSVCSDITNQACQRRRRSINNPQDMELLADFIQEQEYVYSNKIQKRQAGNTSITDRNVFFVVDSSGSIQPDNYTRVLNILANFSELFCGDVAIGMFTFSRHIELEFCPTCFRNDDYQTYINEVTTRIRSARYHRSLTYTGEMAKCLRQHVLPSPDCRLLDKKTQIVFFTDGRANGCMDVPPVIAELEAAYPNLEVYAIGMGNILQSGILDLLTINYDPNNIFNVQNITQLQGLLDAIYTAIKVGQIECSPVSFGK